MGKKIQHYGKRKKKKKNPGGNADHRLGNGILDGTKNTINKKTESTKAKNLYGSKEENENTNRMGEHIYKLCI